jgi:uncharacterized protein (DUF302 family)
VRARPPSAIRRVTLHAPLRAAGIAIGSLLLSSACAARAGNAARVGEGGQAGAPRAEVAPQAGLVTIRSAHPVDSTAARLVAALERRGVRVAARVDHAAAARQAGLTLRPTLLIIAGNPAAGTPLMQSDQRAGIDLPLKFLIWQRESGEVLLSYNAIDYVAARHTLSGVDAPLGRIRTALEDVAREATSP